MILRGNVTSQVLGMDTGLTVLCADDRWEGPRKVVYLLHGLWGDADSWLDYTMLPTHAGDVYKRQMHEDHSLPHVEMPCNRAFSLIIPICGPKCNR